MAFDLYTHEEIYGVLSEVVPFKQQILPHFGTQLNFDTEVIDFDKISDDLRISIYVAPEASARATYERGYSTKKYTAPYTKQKESVNTKKLWKRAAGEAINNFGSPAEKYRAALLQTAVDMRTRHMRFMEVQASKLILAGSYTAVSELYPNPVIIDFERSANNAYNFTTLNANGGVGKRAWGSTGGTTTVSPIADIEEFLDACQEHIETLYISEDAWAELKKDTNFKTLIDVTVRQATSLSVELGPKQGTIQGLKYRGNLVSNNCEIYTYTGTYQDPTTGTITRYFPLGYVIGLPSSSFGTIAYGAIQHGEAEYQPFEMFWNMWMEPEFGIPYIQMQSAPMLVHTKINSTFAHKVM